LPMSLWTPQRKKKKEEKHFMAGPDVAESNKPPLPPPALTHLNGNTVR
jgi:hypothetical protein